MKTRLVGLFCLWSTLASAQVLWDSETDTLVSGRTSDPAVVWNGPSALIIATDPAMYGIYTFGTGGGTLVQQFSIGQVRSADARQGLVVATVPTTGTLVTYGAEADGGLTSFLPTTFPLPGDAGPIDPRGVALESLADGGFHAWVNTSGGVLRRFAIERVSAGEVLYLPQGTADVPENPSGLAVDDVSGSLFVTQPNTGVMRVDMDPTGAVTKSVVIDIDGGPPLGGLGVYADTDGGVIVFTASPSTSEINVHRVEGTNSQFLFTFELAPPDGGVQPNRSPSHLALVATPFPGFAHGVLVVNSDDEARYRLVSLSHIPSLPDALAWQPPMMVDGGTPDAGSTDAGSTDAGVNDGGAGTDAGTSDGGTTDAGVRDAGSGAGGGTGGRPGGFPGSEDPEPRPCGCNAPPLSILPALLLLWWIRRPRS